LAVPTQETGVQANENQYKLEIFDMKSGNENLNGGSDILTYFSILNVTRNIVLPQTSVGTAIDVLGSKVLRRFLARLLARPQFFAWDYRL
jgi:hypothetical protein